MNPSKCLKFDKIYNVSYYRKDLATRKINLTVWAMDFIWVHKAPETVKPGDLVINSNIGFNDIYFLKDIPFYNTRLKSLHHLECALHKKVLQMLLRSSGKP